MIDRPNNDCFPSLETKILINLSDQLTTLHTELIQDIVADNEKEYFVQYNTLIYRCIHQHIWVIHDDFFYTELDTLVNHTIKEYKSTATSLNSVDIALLTIQDSLSEKIMELIKNHHSIPDVYTKEILTKRNEISAVFWKN